jgi:hypothetical protein
VIGWSFSHYPVDGVSHLWKLCLIPSSDLRYICMRCQFVLSLLHFVMRSPIQHNMASHAKNCPATVFGTYHSILRDENPWQWHVTTGMFVVGFASTGVLFVTGGWLTRLVILSWWPVSDIAMFLVEKYCRRKKGLPVTSALELSSEKVCQQLDTTSYPGDYQISSSPSFSTWDKTVFSDIEFLRQLDERFDDYSATIAEVLVLMRKNHSNLPRPKITADRCKVRLLDFQSVARIFGPTTVPQVDLLDMEERLARCLYLSDHTRLKVKVLYFWVVAVYRLHKHADLVQIIDRLDSMMAGIEETQERYGEFCTREPHCVTQQAALRHDWVSLTVHVALLRANLNYQLTPICWRGGTEPCAAYETDSVIERGKGSGCDIPVGVQSQQVASMDGGNIATSCHTLDGATTDGAAAALPLHDNFDSAKTDPLSLKNLF